MTGRRHLGAALGCAVLLVTLAAGCDDTPAPTGGASGTAATGAATPAPSAAATGTATPTPLPAVSLEPGETLVHVHFAQEGAGCDAVVPFGRAVPPDDEVLVTALLEQLAGPTEAEAAAGYTSFFSAATAGMLRGAGVIDGVAYVDLDAALPATIPNASTSCGSAALLAALGATVADAAGVGTVRYALDGEPAPFYEWLQSSCEFEDACDPAPFASLDAN